MASNDAIAYNAAVFFSTLFLLEFGADKFVDHTAIVARRTGIPDTVIALVTAGAEWEELVVVVWSLAQGRPSLAVGNIVGAAISNILGAFSLGLVFRQCEEPARFDRSSKIYSVLSLLVATIVTPIAYFPHRIVWLASGTVLIVVFAVYAVSIGWAIRRGIVSAPEDSDTDSSNDEGSDDGGPESDPAATGPLAQDSRETDALLSPPNSLTPVPAATRRHHERRSLRYHIFYLVLGFLTICLAGYLLSHAAANIADAIGTSEVVFGVVILAIATTLPEKFIAVLSGHRGHMGILAANTAGSNIFLLTLCMGIIMVDTSGKFNGGSVNIMELAVLWASSVAFTATVWLGGRFHRWIGVAMLAGYVAFIFVEFAVARDAQWLS